MDTEIAITDIELMQCIRLLSISLRGTAKEIPAATLLHLRDLYDSEKFSECIREIKKIYRLGFSLRICYINSRSSQESIIRFALDTTKEMGYVNPRIGGVSQDLTSCGAIILQPSHIPLYSTSSFDNMRLLMIVFRQYAMVSCETFIYAIAHEMAHIVLGSMQHPLQHSEIATDLTAMIMGFSDIIKIGRRCGVFKLGYLDDRQFELAYSEIQRRKKIIYL